MLDATLSRFRASPMIGGLLACPGLQQPSPFSHADWLSAQLKASSHVDGAPSWASATIAGVVLPSEPDQLHIQRSVDTRHDAAVAISQAMTRKVYRVRNIPGHADRHAAAQLLARSIGDATLDIEVHSLAKAVDPWELPPTKTATVTFSHAPNLTNTQGGRSNEWRLVVAGLRNALILDTHFEGFTPLNDLDPNNHSYE
jgi:hypothetical protein